MKADKSFEKLGYTEALEANGIREYHGSFGTIDINFKEKQAAKFNGVFTEPMTLCEMAAAIKCIKEREREELTPAPCPLCGGRAIFRRTEENQVLMQAGLSPHVPGLKPVSVGQTICPACKLQIKMKYDKETTDKMIKRDLVKRWNRRPEDGAN